MTDPVAPAGRVERRTGDRRDAQRRSGEARQPRDLTAFAPAEDAGRPASDAAPEAAPAVPDVAAVAFAAQVLGQTGARKGLRGGPPVLDAARSTYLGTEYSGPNDRRPPPGRATRTKA